MLSASPRKSALTIQQCPGDAATAFLIAHEVAHHQLGHLDVFAGLASPLPRFGGTDVIPAACQLLVRRLYSPEHELAADRLGLELCVPAGYNGRHCLRLLEVLEDDALNHGDIEAVYGPDAATDPDSADSPWAQAWVWVSERLRGCVPLRQRLMTLGHQLGDPATWPGAPTEGKKLTPGPPEPASGGPPYLRGSRQERYPQA